MVNECEQQGSKNWKQWKIKFFFSNNLNILLILKKTCVIDPLDQIKIRD